MDRETARLSSRFLSYGLPFLYLLTAIAFYLHTYDSAQVKITIVQMGGTLLIGYWYVNLLCEGRVPWQKYGPLAFPLIIALASGLLSFSHAAYRGPSLDECLRRVFYVHFALIALKEINTLERLKRVVFYIMIATAISAIYGLIQFLDYRFFPTVPQIDPFVWHQAFGDRIFSTFGNPNFFGNFLVVVAWITLALIFKRAPERPTSILLFVILVNVASAVAWQANRMAAAFDVSSWTNAFIVMVLLAVGIFALMRFSFLGVLFFIITLCIDVTQSKGAWVGYIGGFSIFMLLVLFFFPQFQEERIRRNVRRVSIAMLVLAFLGVGYYSLARVDSIRFRICTWVSTFEMGAMHPVWGNGIGSFRILYPAFRRPQIFHIEGKHNTETDHAEDEYWEVFQDEGLLGFGIFIWVIATFSVLGVRALGRFTEGLSVKDPGSGKWKISNDPRAFYMLGLLSSAGGMLIHNCMDVSLRFVSSGIFLWLLLGLIGAMVVHDPLPETDAQRQSREPKEVPGDDPPQALRVGAGAVTAVLFILFTWKVLQEFNDTQSAMPEAGGELLLWSIAWAAMLLTLGLALYTTYRLTRSMKNVYGFIILCAMLLPMRVFWGWFMADVYHNRGIFYSKNGNWQAAIDNYSKVVALNPNYIMAYYFMGNVYTDRWQPGDFENAMHEYDKVWAIAPNYVQSHHQAGLVYLKKGQFDKQTADQLHAQGKNAEAMSALLDAKKDWEMALVFFQKYHDIDPVFEPNYTREGWVHMQLADLDNQMGRPQDAQAQYDIAEAGYRESLYAAKCRARENDVLGEHWGQAPMIANVWGPRGVYWLLRHHWPGPINALVQFYGNYLTRDWQNRQHVHFSAEMFENLGNVCFVRGRFTGAEQAYRMSLEQDTQNVRVLKNLASVYARMGRSNDVLRTWRRVQTLNPQDPDLQRLFTHASKPASLHS